MLGSTVVLREHMALAAEKYVVSEIVSVDD